VAVIMLASAQQFRQPDQIERGAREHHEPFDLLQAAEFDLRCSGDT